MGVKFLQTTEATDLADRRFPCSRGGRDKAEAPASSMLEMLADECDDPAAVRDTLGVSTGFGNLYQKTPADGTIVVIAKAPFAMTVVGVLGVKTGAGSLTLAVQIGGVPVTGLSALSVTTATQDATAAGANLVPVGGRLTVVISGAIAPSDLECLIELAR